jgi:SAM-dependent methyltransferase
MEKTVREQYESYPYPLRDPSEGESDAIVGPLENLRIVNHHCFGGRRDWTRPFRVLVAGGGTGDASTDLGSQLQRIGGGEVVHLDLSEASQEVARSRAEAAGLDNVTFVRGSLLDVASMDLGVFDYINCSGVLHHLEEPEQGAEALASVLAPEGCLGIMVYGELGRTGVYHAQEMLRMLSGTRDAEGRLALARQLLPQLPHSNWLVQNDVMKWSSELDDSEVFDRFLHSCDRAYRVPGAVDLMASAGLDVLHFTPGLLFEPSTFLHDPELLAEIDRWPWLEQAAFTELLFGLIYKLSFFAGRALDPPRAVASTLDLDAVPVSLLASGAELSDRIRRDGRLTFSLGAVTFSPTIQFEPLVDEILRAIDGRTSLGAIHADVGARHGVDVETFLQAFHVVYELLHGAELLMLGYRPR